MCFLRSPDVRHWAICFRKTLCVKISNIAGDGFQVIVRRTVCTSANVAIFIIYLLVQTAKGTSSFLYMWAAFTHIGDSRWCAIQASFHWFNPSWQALRSRSMGQRLSRFLHNLAQCAYTHRGHHKPNCSHTETQHPGIYHQHEIHILVIFHKLCQGQSISGLGLGWNINSILLAKGDVYLNCAPYEVKLLLLRY